MRKPNEALDVVRKLNQRIKLKAESSNLKPLEGLGLPKLSHGHRIQGDLLLKGRQRGQVSILVVSRYMYLPVRDCSPLRWSRGEQALLSNTKVEFCCL